MIKLKKPLPITHQKQGIQIGRSVIIVQLKYGEELFLNSKRHAETNPEQVQSLFAKRDSRIKDRKLKKLLKDMMEFEEELIQDRVQPQPHELRVQQTSQSGGIILNSNFLS